MNECAGLVFCLSLLFHFYSPCVHKEDACLPASGTFKYYVEEMKLSKEAANAILHPQVFFLSFPFL